ncbi:hypothetical protein COO60DRAFT_571509 [Scenedesmus sp. NREL 46B-D3]|nr:hypothetical protein COO60DRAFT_571509 [Scenedesmus sp. NREL 46B-D3]
MLSDRLAKELARTLVRQSSGGLTDQQVDDFLALYDQQVPDSIKSDPQVLQHLLDESKHIARDIDGYDMPSISVSVQDFRFSPPSISAELPCTLQFRLLPHSSRQQIIVLHSGSRQRVASSGLLRGGDSFAVTICDPGAYTFTSEVYPFMSGTLTAAAVSSTAAVEEEEDAAGAAIEPLVPTAVATAVLHKLQSTGQQAAASGSSRPRADSPRLAAKAVLQLQQQMVQLKCSPTSDTDKRATPDVADGAVLATNTADAPQAEVHAATAGAAAVFKCVSDPCDGLVQQPSECAVLELLSITATRSAVLCAPNSTASTIDRSLPDLSRAGRWARRATAYGDEADTGPQTAAAWQSRAAQVQPTSGLSGVTTAGAAAEVQREVAATSHFLVPAGSSSVNHSSFMGAAAAVAAAAAAAAAATSAAHADAATYGAAGSCLRPAGTAAPEDMDIDDDSYAAAQQQQPGALPMLGFAKGLEGLTLGPEPLPGLAGAAAAAVPHGSSSCNRAAGAGGGLQRAAAASASSEEAAVCWPSSSVQDDSAACEMQPVDGGVDGCGWYERLRSDSDHSSASSSDDDEQEQQGVTGKAQHRRSWRYSCEAAHLLGDEGAVQRPQRRRLAAWGRSVDGSCDGEAPSPTSSLSSGGGAGDVRLRSLHKRGAAASTAAVQQWQQQCKLGEADDVLMVEDVEEYGPYEPLASGDVSAAPEPAAAHGIGTANLQPRLQPCGDAPTGTAEAAAQTLPPLRNRAGLLQRPPGSSWSLGGSAVLAVGGGVCSTFSSTHHAPLAGSELPGSGSSSRYAAEEGCEAGWKQRTNAAAAATRPTYYERLTNNRRHVGLDALLR